MEGVSNPSVLGLFFEAGTVVKLVMLTLLLMSIISWTIIFNKVMQLKLANVRLVKFLRKITDRNTDLAAVFEKAKKSNDLASKLFLKAANDAEDAMRDGNSANSSDFRKELESALIAKLNTELMEAEKYLGFLATVGSSAVFIGLFGTVWGIMDSFQSIGIAKNTSLAVVAPGIAEALLATAMGLIAAIPAKIFYNKFSADINRIAVNGEVLIPCITKKIVADIKK